MGNYYKQSLLRTAKINALERNYKAGGRDEATPKDMIFLHGGVQLFATPTPRRILDAFKQAAKQAESRMSEKNRDIFNKLWGIKPEDLDERPRHADHLREFAYKKKAASKLSGEILPKDIYIAEPVDPDEVDRAWDDYVEEEEDDDGNDTTPPAEDDKEPKLASWDDVGSSDWNGGGFGYEAVTIVDGRKVKW